MRRTRSSWPATLVAALLLSLLPAGLALTAPAPAHADECYTWGRTLREGASGSDVTQLQIRVAGWAGYDRGFAVDGQYGPATTTAVRNFQSAYGLAADGVAGSQTFSKLYALQDADCTPVHFAWSEVDDVCFGGFPTPVSGTTVAQVKANLMQVMWRAEALRHRLGDHPLRVTSAYRMRRVQPPRRWCDQQQPPVRTGDRPGAGQLGDDDVRASRSPRATRPSVSCSGPATRTTTTTSTSASSPRSSGARRVAGSEPPALPHRSGRHYFRGAGPRIGRGRHNGGSTRWQASSRCTRTRPGSSGSG